MITTKIKESLLYIGFKDITDGDSDCIHYKKANDVVEIDYHYCCINVYSDINVIPTKTYTFVDYYNDVIKTLVRLHKLKALLTPMNEQKVYDTFKLLNRDILSDSLSRYVIDSKIFIIEDNTLDEIDIVSEHWDKILEFNLISDTTINFIKLFNSYYNKEYKKVNIIF